MVLTDPVQELLEGEVPLPAFVYDLGALRQHVLWARQRFGSAAQLYYAVKANPDPRILSVLAPLVDGFDVSSAGEVRHARAVAPGVPLALSGPGKTDDDLREARQVDYLHVESPNELQRLVATGAPWRVLLRANLDLPCPEAHWSTGGNSALGMDEDGIAACMALATEHPQLTMAGIHVHLASGLGPQTLLAIARAALRLSRRYGLCLVNTGGGLRVDYGKPAERFDWQTFGEGLAELRQPGETLRIEPGRALAAYCGWYVTHVIDVKHVHSRAYAVVAGGTHHLRTPASKGHDQPYTVLPARRRGPGIRREQVSLVGQLCTPRDQLSGPVHVDSLHVGDRIAFALAGAYGWNISPHEFLMHPAPSFHYV